MKWLKFNRSLILMSQSKSVLRKLVMICAFSGRFVCGQRTKGGSSLHQVGIYLIRLISRAWIFSPCTFRPAIGEGEDQMYPVAVRKAVKLGSDPQVSRFFPAGGAGTAVAGVSEVFNVPTVGIIATIFLHTGDAGAAGQHLCDGFHFDIAQPAGIQEGIPALVGGEQFFERAGAETRNHGID